MHSCIVLVDAGYFYAAAGELVHNTRSRRDLILNCSAVCKLLSGFAEENSGKPLLRIYWYDAAPNRVPSDEHLLIGSQENVKLRLGRLSERGTQKGVDLLIYRDLFTLAESRAISHAFLLTGDEDLMEAITDAQARGIKVSLIGIDPIAHNQSTRLQSAADAVYVLQREVLMPTLSQRPHSPKSAPASESRLRTLEAQFNGQGGLEPATPQEREEMGMVAGQVANEFLDDASEIELDEISHQVDLNLDDRRIPSRADAWLLSAAGRGLERPVHRTDKPYLREAFWHRVEEELE